MATINDSPHLGIPQLELKQPIPIREERFISTNVTDLLFTTLQQQHDKLLERLERVEALALDLATAPTAHEAATPAPALDVDALRIELLDAITNISHDAQDWLARSLTTVDGYNAQVLSRVSTVQTGLTQLEQRLNDVSTALAAQAHDTSTALSSVHTALASRYSQQEQHMAAVAQRQDALMVHLDELKADIASLPPPPESVTPAQLMDTAAELRNELTEVVASGNQDTHRVMFQMLASVTSHSDHLSLEMKQHATATQEALVTHKAGVDATLAGLHQDVTGAVTSLREQHLHDTASLYAALDDRHTRLLTAISEHAATAHDEFATHANETRGIVAHLQAVVLSEIADVKRQQAADSNALLSVLQAQQVWREHQEQVIAERLDAIHHDTFLSTLQRLWKRITRWRHN